MRILINPYQSISTRKAYIAVYEQNREIGRSLLIFQRGEPKQEPPEFGLAHPSG